ncbi:tetratricopeptide repeat protein [Fervidobacterium thailandense]|uniref:Uncharacterized protein n=1 Tax=Fervidobacterium thailandense TaxID=1008305 RepID=A0A1E3G1C2_9BACT|nr:tetratricopeptide repeat protein [Fervidobacterium thailandense]ODN29940.1 hypothetical protein A4H02_08005 [Fervidobacterium thailandense]
MKKTEGFHRILLSWITVSTILFSGLVFGNFVERFNNARSLQNVREMERLISDLEREVSNGNGSGFVRTLLAESYLEYGSWAEQKNKKLFFEKALIQARDVIKNDSKNGRAYYVAAVAVSRLIEYAFVFEKLALLNQFDEYMPKAIELLDDRLYKGLAYMGMALRYTNPPWPFNDYRKAEQLFKEAEKFIPDYSGLYLNFGAFYLKIGNRQKAQELLEKVLSMQPHPLFKKAHEDNVARAREYLKEIKQKGG